MIATYAMCGFASLTAIGVAMGVLRTIAPNRMKDASAIAMRAMIAGNGANFLTACVAGGRTRLIYYLFGNIYKAPRIRVKNVLQSANNIKQINRGKSGNMSHVFTLIF